MLWKCGIHKLNGGKLIMIIKCLSIKSSKEGKPITAYPILKSWVI